MNQHLPGGADDQWREDLQDSLATGLDRGAPRWESGGYRTAHEVKPVHRRLRSITDDDLKRLPIVPVGSRLEQGATYIDLLADRPREFTGTADFTTGPENACILKSEVDYELWNRLIGLLDTDQHRAS